MLVVGGVVVKVDVPEVGHNLIVLAAARIGAADEVDVGFALVGDWAGHGAERKAKKEGGDCGNVHGCGETVQRSNVWTLGLGVGIEC